MGDESKQSGCPVMHKKEPSPPPKTGGTCPVKLGNQPDAEKLDPDNMMPEANQQPRPGQRMKLGTDRVVSGIPKGSTGENWVYPSEQMFFNSLHRKGKGEGVEEESMEAVIAIHNNMNENAWREVLRWEALHSHKCDAPTLLRFMGRPHELTNKAALKYYTGLAPRPFDRHDWTVDRCGKHVRYVIDYYDDARHHGRDKVPGLHEIGAVPSIKMDVRPALDGPGAAVDRLRMLWRDVVNGSSSGGGAAAAGGSSSAATGGSSDAGAAAESRPPPVAADAGAAAEPALAPAPAPPSGKTTLADLVRDRCAERFAALSACTNDKECAMAHIGLTACIAQQVCRDEFRAFDACKNGADEAAAGARFEAMQECVARWGRAAAAGGGEGE